MRSKGNKDYADSDCAAPDLAGEDGGSDRVAQVDCEERPIVAFLDDVRFFHTSLSSILTDSGCEARLLKSDGSAAHLLPETIGDPSLLILPIIGSSPDTVERLRGLRSVPELRDIPILGVSTLDRSGLDFDELRSLGVVGLLDKNALPEHVTFRVNQQVRSTALTGRRWVRAPACFPVDLTTEGENTTEYAVSLSIGGLGVRSAREIEVNSDVRVSFHVDAPERRFVSADARVTHSTRVEGLVVPPYLLGLVFYPLGADDLEAIAMQVSGLLSRIGEDFE